MSFLRDLWFKRHGVKALSCHLIKRRVETVTPTTFRGLTECGVEFEFQSEGAAKLQRAGCCKRCKAAVRHVRERKR